MSERQHTFTITVTESDLCRFWLQGIRACGRPPEGGLDPQAECEAQLRAAALELPDPTEDELRQWQDRFLRRKSCGRCACPEPCAGVCETAWTQGYEFDANLARIYGLPLERLREISAGGVLTREEMIPFRHGLYAVIGYAVRQKAQRVGA